MLQKITLEQLRVSVAEKSFPLIRLLEPTATLKEWKEFTKKLSRKPNVNGGVIAENERGYIFGLYCYEVRAGIDRQLILEVGKFIALENAITVGIEDILVGSMADRARELACSKIHLWLPISWFQDAEFVESISSRLGQNGFRPDQYPPSGLDDIGDKRKLCFVDNIRRIYN